MKATLSITRTGPGSVRITIATENSNRELERYRMALETIHDQPAVNAARVAARAMDR